jgi:hypothetical protein
MKYQTKIYQKKVFRGQLMKNNEFDRKIRYNTGDLFPISTFLSTTPHENLATVYAGSGNEE